MNEYILQNIIFPDPKICDIKEMFFRSSAHYNVEKDILEATRPIHIDFHSYFNIIPVKHFNEYLGIEHIDFFAKFKGKAEFLLYANVMGYSEPQLIHHTIVESDDYSYRTDICKFIEIKGINGYLYLVINTHSEIFEMKSFSVSCLSDKEPAKVGIVSCTFKREKEVLRTVECIENIFTNDKFSFKNSQLFVIDNDQKQVLKLHETKKIHHIANKNLGGAGGFTRGIIESINANLDYVLLCDDDILIFGEIFRRAIVTLSLMLDPRKGLHGCMLEEESKYTLHEIGEYFDINKRFHINQHYGKNMTNLSDLKAVVFESFGTSKSSNMFGWWFTAFPTSLFKEIGLPLPVFVSGDDLEFSLRAYKHGYSAYISPTISVWHPSHMSQHTPIRNYFITRNRFAYFPLHTSQAKLELLFKKSVKRTYHLLLTKRYATAESNIVALEDFLRGAEWFNEDLTYWIDKMKYLSQEKTQSLYTNKWLVPTFHNHLTKLQNSRKNRILSKLTFNGHIFGSYFHKTADEPSSPYHICIPYGVNPDDPNITKMTFRASSVLYFDPRFSVGYRVKHNTKKFWCLYYRLQKLNLTANLKFSSLYTEYQSQGKEVISLEWWKKRLDLRD